MANKQSVLTINHSGVDYTLFLTYKKINYLIFRAVPGESTQFKVSLPPRYPLHKVESFFKERYTRITGLSKKAELPTFSEETYFFGMLLPVSEICHLIKVKNEPTTLAEFYKMSRKVLLSFISEEVDSYRRKMGISEAYKVRLRLMTSRWATNNVRKLILTFNTKLIHYDKEIIKALIVHELAHHYIHGHQKNFYALCEKYYPGYRGMDKKLKEHNYGNH